VSLKRTAGILAAPFAFLVFTGLNFRGDQFTITFPDGWSTPAVSNTVFTTKSPDGAVNCNAHTTPVPDLSDYTAELIREEFGFFSTADWADLLGIAPEQMIVSEPERIDVNGAWLHVATFTISTGGIIKQPTKVRYAAIVTPGKVNMSGCYALPGDFDAHRPTFDRVVKSLRPL
jgi:hypothetical protein